MTTCAGNIGVMAVTRIYSTLIFVVVAVVMGMSPRLGALVGTIPGPVLGGLSVVLFGFCRPWRRPDSVSRRTSSTSMYAARATASARPLPPSPRQIHSP